MESQFQKIQLARGFEQLFNLKFGSIYDKIGEVFTRKPYNLTKTLDALRNAIAREDRKRKKQIKIRKDDSANCLFIKVYKPFFGE